MANKESILGFIGLARKAGKVASGTDSVIKALTNGSAKLLIVAEDVSSNTVSKILDNVTYEIGMYRFATMDELGAAINSAPKGVIAITDEGFAAGIDKKLASVRRKMNE